MKKSIAMVISALVILSLAACSSNENEIASSQDTNYSSVVNDTASMTQQSSSEDSGSIEASDESVKNKASEIIERYGFEGIILAERSGEPILSYSKGTLENGESITPSTPIPAGSISKHICAAAVLLLEEQGKLSTNDAIDKYFPEYEHGSEITIHDLLSHRSGIAEVFDQTTIETVFTDDKTEEENISAAKEMIFKKSLRYDPGTTFEYTNSNYFLLGLIVEQAAEMNYSDYLRESFFDPLEMKNTGTVDEMADSPEWLQGLTYKKIDSSPGITKGAGDIVTSANDMMIWLNNLSEGTVISKESFEKMTTDYSPSVHYGYGLYVELSGGAGHAGQTGIYSSFAYYNKEKGYAQILISNNLPPTTSVGAAQKLYGELM